MDTETHLSLHHCETLLPVYKCGVLDEWWTEDRFDEGIGDRLRNERKEGNCFRGNDLQCNRLYDIRGKTEDEGAVWRSGGTAGGTLILTLIAAATARLIGLRDRRGGHGGLQAAKGKDRNKENNYGDYAKQR